MPYRQNVCGFTLIEILSVIVILGLVGAIGSSFVVKTIALYDTSQERYTLLRQNHLTQEQLHRQIGMAWPRSVRVNTTGTCVEFLPLLATTRYENNNVSREALSSIHVLTTLGAQQFRSPFLEKGIVNQSYFNQVYAGVGVKSLEEIYGENASAIVAVRVPKNAAFNKMVLDREHVFLRDDPDKIVLLISSPRRFCIENKELVRYSDYGIVKGEMTTAPPRGKRVLFANNLHGDDSRFRLLDVSRGDRGLSVGMSLGVPSERLSEMSLERSSTFDAKAPTVVRADLVFQKRNLQVSVPRDIWVKHHVH